MSIIVTGSAVTVCWMASVCSMVMLVCSLASNLSATGSSFRLRIRLIINNYQFTSDATHVLKVEPLTGTAASSTTCSTWSRSRRTGTRRSRPQTVGNLLKIHCIFIHYQISTETHTHMSTHFASILTKRVHHRRVVEPEPVVRWQHSYQQLRWAAVG